MWNFLLAPILFSILQTPGTGTIVGIVKPGGTMKLTKPFQVVLIPPRYLEMWNSEVQKRLDNYWEEYKPEFAANKEHFREFYYLAQREALRVIVSSMRREMGAQAAAFIKETSLTGQFEFRNIFLGSYRIIAAGKITDQELIFFGAVEINNPIPQFIELGKPTS